MHCYYLVLISSLFLVGQIRGCLNKASDPIEPTTRRPEPNRKLVGAPTEVDKDAKWIEDLRMKSEDRYNRMVNSMYLHKAVSVENPTQQVVAGTLYRAQVTFKATKCRKTNDKFTLDASDMSSCGTSDEDTSMATCDASLWIKSWENFEELKLENCRNQ